MKGLFIYPNGTAEVKEVDRPIYPNANDALGVKWIEVLGFDNAYFVFDEEGKYNGQQPNEFATSLLYSLGHELMPGDILAGPVAIFGPHNGQHPTDVTDHLLGDSLVKKALEGGV